MSTTLLPTTTLNHGEGSTGDESSLLQQLSSSYSSIWSAKTNTIPSAAALCVNTALMTAALALLSAASGSDKDTQALIEWAGLQQLNLEGLWMFSVCAAVVVLLLITGLLAVYSEQLTCRARTDSSYAEEATPRSALMARPLDADKQSVRNTVAYSRTLALFCDGLTLFMVAPIIQAALASIDTIAGSCGFLLALLALTAFKLLLSSADTIHHSYYTQEMCRAKEMFSSSAMAWALVLTYSTLLHQALVALAALRPGILFLGCASHRPLMSCRRCAGYAVVHSCVAAAALLCVHRGRRMQLTLSLEDPPAALQQASSTHVPTIPGSHFTPAGGVLRKVLCSSLLSSHSPGGGALCCCCAGGRAIHCRAAPAAAWCAARGAVVEDLDGVCCADWGSAGGHSLWVAGGGQAGGVQTAFLWARECESV
eukprot:TRINITY_DN11287_c0_g1_i4.p1 TRINITY_DN11287_c0_g1~~TRINITY_DN11287_c0_g1_i4.p1  ORF type:complete len:425 (-),score=108.63 TRINITY_DN11287_c0_g1_i4:309-1583(-)